MLIIIVDYDEHKLGKLISLIPNYQVDVNRKSYIINAGLINIQNHIILIPIYPINSLNNDNMSR